jgi:ADP-ribose pyrophosphatase YjhB (NUDIX family)
MKISSSFINRSGQKIDVMHEDVDSLAELGKRKVSGTNALCFCDGKLVIVYAKEKGYWTPPGGALEAGESIEDGLKREIKEETNMKVLRYKVIGFQDYFALDRTYGLVRFACLVEPYGPFISDPDGDITEVKLIDPTDYKKYFDWGEIGDRLMERAMQFVL